MKINETTYMAFNKSLEDAKIIYFGAPYDGTTTFKPGARFGPRAIREDSFGLETYSPYLNLDLEEDTAILDIGDLELPLGNRDQSLALIGEHVASILAHGKAPLMVGGEHLVSLPAIEEMLKVYPDLVVIHLDAHTDLRDEYLGEKLSHSTVMRRVAEMVEEDGLLHFGIRSGLKEEFLFAQARGALHPFNLKALTLLKDRLKDRPVYLSLDLDVLDPSVFPGTGTPEPGGVTFRELLAGLMSLRGLKIVGADIVELAPMYDPSGVSTQCACKAVREIALLMSEGKE